ncbi:MAG: hypothetical protein DMD80_00455 [Candidatus Rokuibacteriota bacterium]|nr:MAG: hypothetical protein DMD80_00455 [Candidatus Rokubacteria bacterium]
MRSAVSQVAVALQRKHVDLRVLPRAIDHVPRFSRKARIRRRPDALRVRRREWLDLGLRDALVVAVPAGLHGVRLCARPRHQADRRGARPSLVALSPYCPRGTLPPNSRRQRRRRCAMPFVNITLYEGHPKERKDEIARRVTETITEVCKLPPQAVWVVFNEVTPPDWYVAGNPGKK